MNTEQEKAKNEIQVFLDFIACLNLQIDNASVEKRNPPEPDILCRHLEEGLIAFELVELCDSNIASAINKRNPPAVDCFYTSDPSIEVITKKMLKKYQSAYLIELLCYTNDRLVTPDDVIIPTIIPYLECNSGQFRRVWFFGKEISGLIYEKP